VSRFVIQPTNGGSSGLDEVGGFEPLDDTGLFVADAPDPRTLVERSQRIAWAAPVSGDGGEESYPTGELSIRFSHPLRSSDLSSFVERYGLEFRRQNQFVPEQVVVAPARPLRTWLPTLVERLNSESVVARAWPNTLSRYRRVVVPSGDRSAASSR
jgi:hypothetical protein